MEQQMPRLLDKELAAKLEEAIVMWPPHTLVRHNKLNTTYTVEMCVLRESDLMPLVVYRALNIHGIVRFARPLREFGEKFTRL